MTRNNQTHPYDAMGEHARDDARDAVRVEELAHLIGDMTGCADSDSVYAAQAVVELLASRGALASRDAVGRDGCKHDPVAAYDHARCRACGWVLTDSGWGIAKNQWFPSLDAARFYKQHGRHPAPPAQEPGA